MEDLHSLVVVRRAARTAIDQLRDPFVGAYPFGVRSRTGTFRHRIEVALGAGEIEVVRAVAMRQLAEYGFRSARLLVQDRRLLDLLDRLSNFVLADDHRGMVSAWDRKASSFRVPESPAFAALREAIADFLVASVFRPEIGDIDGAAKLVCELETLARAADPATPHRSWRTPLAGCVLVLPFEFHPPAHDTAAARERSPLPVVYALHQPQPARAVRP